MISIDDSEWWCRWLFFSQWKFFRSNGEKKPKHPHSFTRYSWTFRCHVWQLSLPVWGSCKIYLQEMDIAIYREGHFVQPNRFEHVLLDLGSKNYKINPLKFKSWIYSCSFWQCLKSVPKNMETWCDHLHPSHKPYVDPLGILGLFRVLGKWWSQLGYNGITLVYLWVLPPGLWYFYAWGS